MGEWCADHLKDLQGWKDEGLEISMVSNETAKLFDSTVRQLVSYRDCDSMGGFLVTLNKTLENEPNAVMPRAFNLGIHALGTGLSVDDHEYGDKIESLLSDAKKFGNKRELLHANAVKAIATGNSKQALVYYEQILAEHPTDLMALKFSQNAYLFTGNSYGIRDSVGRVVNHYSNQDPMYPFVLGMQAFGLEETNMIPEAEKVAKHALTLRKEECWATHALSHCFEMTNRHTEGIEMLESTAEYWRPGWIIECHNLWHWALFYYDLENYDKSLQIYDEYIRKIFNKQQSVLDLTDAASLLYRLELKGVNVGKQRWEELLPVAYFHINNHSYAFNDPHIAFVLTKCGETDKMKEFIEINESYESEHFTDVSFNTRNFSTPVIKAVDSFSAANYQNCFDLLYPIRSQFNHMGGSNAQRDVITQLLITSGFLVNNFEYRVKAL
uniref:Tetratricopeptide repeat protein 38 n=1 Tax=Rhabditophanes sp. KR3021 TaxID=114890 RepID=A0AC35U6I9_9BILA